MHAFTALFTTLVAAASVMAAPAVKNTSELVARDAPNIGYGQQIQRSNEQNWWVVWIEGKSACPNTVSLGPLVTNPCNYVFFIDGWSLHFGDCDGNNEPRSLYSGNSYIRRCVGDSDKINCHDGLHDIVKHGKCKA
ncbi:hypothetical protein F5Y17DRAFT_440065 [Xylariaceae sp. FL0594]|nr:hypothetical protein F5Y17DRAFT_440065 [Xylariaceae sp. FL0594]